MNHETTSQHTTNQQLEETSSTVDYRALLSDIADQLSKIIETEWRHTFKAWDMQALMTLDDVASYLNVSARTVENLVATGELIPIYVRKARRFCPQAVKAFVKQSTRNR